MVLSVQHISKHCPTPRMKSQLCIKMQVLKYRYILNFTKGNGLCKTLGTFMNSFLD